jgi:hypothetical protein
MRSSIQTTVLIVALIGVVGGITFVKNWTSKASSDTPPRENVVILDGGPPTGTKKIKEARLSYPVTVVEGLPEYELNGKGHHDFWFENSNDYDVEVGFENKSCQCSKIEVLTLSPEEAQTIHKVVPAAAVTQVLSSSGGLLDLVGLAASTNNRVIGFMGDAKRWQFLDRGDDKAIPVAAKGSGYVRLNWERRQSGPIRLAAKVWVQAKGNPRTRSGGTSLEVPITVVSAFRYFPDILKVPDLQPNTQASSDLYFWSSTRAGFALHAHEATNDPCFTCTSTPLTGDAFREVADILQKEQEGTHPLTIYRVGLTVNERLTDGTQMDLGPFYREIILTTDHKDSEPMSVGASGVVRGVVTVGTFEDRDQINLHSFPANRGTTKSFPIGSNQPGLELAVESVVPNYVHVDLQKHPGPGGSMRWDVSVTVPPDRAMGPLPKDSVIVLKTGGDSPRRIRVPVKGRAGLSLGGH